MSLKAHYLIPQNAEITSVLQVKALDEAVPYKNKAGELSYREGRVVIMLVGESGIFRKVVVMKVNLFGLLSGKLSIWES